MAAAQHRAACANGSRGGIVGGRRSGGCCSVKNRFAIFHLVGFPARSIARKRFAGGSPLGPPPGPGTGTDGDLFYQRPNASDNDKK